MTRKLLAVICSLLLLFGIGLGAGLLGGLLLVGRGSRDGEPVHSPEKDPPQQKDPTYGLPLEITIEGVPEIPKEILGPSPPIEEGEKQM